MFEVIAIGVLVSLSVFTLSLFMDLALSGRADSSFLDFDLSECESESSSQDEEPGERYAMEMQPSTLSGSALQELSQELQGLDGRNLDFDLSGMDEDAVRH